MRRNIFISLILSIIFGCATTSRVEDIFKIDRYTQTEIWTFNVQDDKIVEPGRILYLNSYDKNKNLVETIKYLEDGRIQWDYYHIKTYKDNKLYEEYYFTVDDLDMRLIDAKFVNTYFANGKLKKSIMFDPEIPQEDTTNVKWTTDFTINYLYNSTDSLIEKRGCEKGSHKCGITSYMYDTINNTVSEEFINENDSTLSTRDLYKYNSDNELIYKIRWYRSSYDSTIFVYENKKLIEEKILFQNGKLFSRTTFEYDKNGELKESNHFNMYDKLEIVEKHRYKKVQ